MALWLYPPIINYFSRPLLPVPLKCDILLTNLSELALSVQYLPVHVGVGGV